MARGTVPGNHCKSQAICNHPQIAFFCSGFYLPYTYRRKMNGGGALWSISRLADCVPSVVYKSTLPRVLVAKRDLDSQCIRRWKQAFRVSYRMYRLVMYLPMGISVYRIVLCILLHSPMVTGVSSVISFCKAHTPGAAVRLSSIRIW